MERKRSEPILLAARWPGAPYPWGAAEDLIGALADGADGFAVTLQRCRDGRLAVFDAPTLDRRADAFGRLGGCRLSETLEVPSRRLYGRELWGRPLAWIEFLNLIRTARAFFYLQLDDPTLGEEAARGLDEAGAWAHLVGAGGSGSRVLLRRSQFRPMPLPENPPSSPAAYFAPKPLAGVGEVKGRILFTWDPRPLAAALKRVPPKPPAFTLTYRVRLSSPGQARGEGGSLAERALDCAKAFAGLPESRLRQLLGEKGDAETAWSLPPAALRACAALALARRGKPSRKTIRRLVELAGRPTWTGDIRTDGIDATMAVRALARARAVRGAPRLIETLGLILAAGGAEGRPAGWGRFRLAAEILEALGELRTPAARARLEELLNKSEKLSLSLKTRAAWALLQYPLGADGAARLLRHSDPAVRAAAVRECLDRGRADLRAALRQAAPWALAWPGAPEPRWRGRAPARQEKGGAVLLRLLRKE